MNTKLGICMDGLEGCFLDAIRSTMRHSNDVWTYFEIGVAYAGTLSGASLLASKYLKRWRCIGVDLPNGWSLDLNHIRSNHPSFTIRNDIPKELPISGTTIFLVGSYNMIPRFDNESIDVAFIDGCHEKECCMSDFVGVEPAIKKGGVVIFHDAGELQQGGDPQPHRGKPIEVFNALVSLGLTKGNRKGWSPIQWCEGMLSSIAIIRKIQ